MKVIVMASSALRPELIVQANSPRLIIVDQIPLKIIRVTTGRVNIPVRGLRGLRFIKSLSGGSMDNARAGRPSVAKLTYKICTAVNGNGKPNNAEPANKPISPMFEESKYIKYFLMLP